METKFNYAVVGLFVILFTIVFFILMIWLSVGLSGKSYVDYLVIMQESVSGLSVKAPVKYSGVEVGYVKSITLRKSDQSQVRVLLSVEQGVPITTSTRAELDNQGLTGIGYIELTGGKRGEPLLKPQPGYEYALIPSNPSLMFRLDTVLEHLSENINQITDGIFRVFDRENTQNLHATISNLKDITQMLKGDSKQLTQIVDDAGVTFQNTATASQQLPELFDALKQAAKTMEAISVDVKEASIEAKNTFTNSSVMVENVNQEVIPEFLTALGRVQTVLENIEGLSEKLDNNPSVLIRGTMPPLPGPGEQ